VQKYKNSEFIFVQNEHDFILYDTLVAKRKTLVSSDLTKLAGIFCVQNVAVDKKKINQKRGKSPFSVGVNFTEFTAYKDMSLQLRGYFI